jgi:hypothetical protein
MASPGAPSIFHTTPVNHRGGKPIVLTMASQHTLATPPPQHAILKSSSKTSAPTTRACRAPTSAWAHANLDAEKPLLLNRLPSPSRAVTRSPSLRLRLLTPTFQPKCTPVLNALHDMTGKQSFSELDLIRQDEGLRPAIRVVHQSFDIYPDCLHRTFDTRRLAVQLLAFASSLQRQICPSFRTPSHSRGLSAALCGAGSGV